MRVVHSQNYAIFIPIHQPETSQKHDMRGFPAWGLQADQRLQPATPSTSRDAALVLEQETMWEPQPDQYQKWVVELACKLLPCTTSLPLQLLRRVVAKSKAELAELLMPWIFTALAGLPPCSAAHVSIV